MSMVTCVRSSTACEGKRVRYEPFADFLLLCACPAMVYRKTLAFTRGQCRLEDRPHAQRTIVPVSDYYLLHL